jgi:hypothetical protein
MDRDRLAAVCATVEVFAAGTAAERVVLLLDAGDPAAPVLVEYAGGSHEVTVGETVERFDPGRHARPLALPGLRAVPATAISADPDSGELSAPLGSIQHLADVVLALARAVGGRSVATATFPTADPRTPLTLAAREGEDVVLELAGRHFSLPSRPTG